MTITKQWAGSANRPSGRRRLGRGMLWAAVLLAGGAQAALGIQPARWVHTSEADFQPGKRDNTVVTNLGDIKLANATTELAVLPDPATIVYDLQELGGGVFVAAGPEARLLVFRDGRLSEQLALEGEQIFCLDVSPAGELLVGVSGATSRLLALTPKGFVTLVELPDVRYLWDLLVDKDANRVYLATGTEGRLLAVDLGKVKPRPYVPSTQPATRAALDAAAGATQPAKADPAVREILDTHQTNLLCLGRDGQGRLYVGTDTHGLIYRVSFDAKGAAEAFVLYDAPEPEIGALVVRPDGTVLAGTADADQARPGRMSTPGTAEIGRVDPTWRGKGELPDHPNIPPRPDPKTLADAAGQADLLRQLAEETGGQLVPATDLPALLARIPKAPVEVIAPGRGAPASAPTVILVDNSQSMAIRDPATQPARLDAVRQALKLAQDTAHPPQVLLLNDGKPGDAEATAEQRDRLRQVIRQRLEAARKTGELTPPPGPKPTAGSPSGRSLGGSGGPAIGRPPGAGRPGPGSREGNAIYRIDPQGFVSEVMRDSIMVLRMLERDNQLLVATGNEGLVLRVDLAAQETTVLADLPAQQIPAMILAGAASGQPHVLLGTANAGALVRLDTATAASGTFTSAALDAGHVSHWGKVTLTGRAPAGGTIALETRSGNVEDPEQAAWSTWSKPQVLAHDPKAAPLSPVAFEVASPPARFLQYRLTLTSDGRASPVAEKLELTYLVPNLKPTITALRSSYPNAPADGSGAGASGPGGGSRPMPRPMGRPGGGTGASGGADPQPATVLNIEWEASDPNNDRLVFVLEYQPAGSTKWLPLAEKLEGTNYEWQTQRVPDGRYILRITASDEADNPPDMARTASRNSDPVVVDNTPPRIERGKTEVVGGRVTIPVLVQDDLSTIHAVHYAMDGADKWVPVLPDAPDLVFDSTKEQLTIRMADLAAGPHVVTIRAVDRQGNAKYDAALVDVK